MLYFQINLYYIFVLRQKYILSLLYLKCSNSGTKVPYMITKKLFPVLIASQLEKTILAARNREIDKLFEAGKILEAEKLKEGSLNRLTFLFGDGRCDFNCSICYTFGSADGVLSAAQAISVIQQVNGMGAQVTYWPGEGELTLLRDFWKIMQYQADCKIPAVVFTDGSIFHSNKLSKSVFGISPDELVCNVAGTFPQLHFYVKFWHSFQRKAAEMVRVKPKNYPYGKIGGKSVPLALVRLLEALGKERVGIQVMVSRENYKDVVENVLPIAKELDIYAYVEPIILAGRAQGRYDLLLTAAQHKTLSKIFASGGEYCEKRQSTELIVKGSMLTPGIAIPPREEDSILDEQGNVKDLFHIFHNGYFSEMRKKSEELGGCLCRAFWEKKLE
ncbi:Uncharacterised protein [Candidatus Anstonella stagnisolia]|nr:Uncharacterised protein [Candidatus Anstonella stagnisolia]